MICVVIKMETKEKQYKWKIVAWSALKNSDNKTWTIQESQWFDKKQACINDFKENMKNGYDVADSWGSEEYLMKRCIMPRRYWNK